MRINNTNNYDIRALIDFGYIERKPDKFCKKRILTIQWQTCKFSDSAYPARFLPPIRFCLISAVNLLP